MSDSIYLDHNSSTPMYPEAVDAMLPYLKDRFGNASSVHKIGQRSRKSIEESRAAMAALVGAEDMNEILFTSGGTESNNLAIKGAFWANRSKGRRIVSSAIEHSSVRFVVRHFAEL